MYHVPPNPQELSSIMGNVLDSDSSAAGSDAENEADPGVIVKVSVPEVRTDGDGMECSGKNSIVHKDASFSGCNHSSSSNTTTDSHPHGQFVQPFIPNNAIQIISEKIIKVPFSEPEPPITFTTPKTLQFRSVAPCVESPKELPPRNQLIHLKPVKKAEPASSNNVPSTSYTQFTNAPVVKQKDPKFVPYEPYKGAVRPMTDDDTGKTHSRKPSSTSSIVSASCPSSGPPTLSESRSATNIGGSPKKESEDSPTHSNRNATLVKERLKMAEKDIVDLQTENSRLKRLFVDSMAGPPNPTQIMSESTNSSITAESFDNLVDEIEVWRSKFLSTCVLVEQLTKENQDLKDASTSAVELFREIKNSTSLTPELFDRVNSWTHQYEQRRSQAHRESFSSYNEDEEALRF